MPAARSGPELADLLARAERRVSAEISAVLEEQGATLYQWRVFTLLADGEGHPMSEIAAYALLPPPTLTKVVDRLVSAGLVHRRVDSVDRRRLLVFLTAAGRELYRRLDRAAESSTAQVLGDLDPDDRAALSQLLSRLTGTPAAP